MSNSQTRQRRESVAMIWAFILSIVLTGFAFLAVGMGMIENKVSLYLFLVLLAFLQVSVQIFYFMHLKERGHKFPLLFASYAVFAAIILVYGIMKWM